MYEYRCTSCGYGFEKIQSFSSAPETVCPKCQGVLVRPVTAPALRFAGAGWYVNDYAGKGAAKSSDAATPTAGETKTDAKPAAASSDSTAATTAPAATPAAASSGAASS